MGDGIKSMHEDMAEVTRFQEMIEANESVKALTGQYQGLLMVSLTARLTRGEHHTLDRILSSLAELIADMLNHPRTALLEQAVAEFGGPNR